MLKNRFLRKITAKAEPTIAANAKIIIDLDTESEFAETDAGEEFGDIEGIMEAETELWSEIEGDTSGAVVA